MFNLVMKMVSIEYDFLTKNLNSLHHVSNMKSLMSAGNGNQTRAMEYVHLTHANK